MSTHRSYLLDTNVFIWWITDAGCLSQTAEETIANPENNIFLSAISGWEIAIKAALGRLEQVGDPELSVPFHAKRNSFKILEFSIAAALRIFNLPRIHQDPFDRALISQAQVLNIPLITSDANIKKYDLECVW